MLCMLPCDALCTACTAYLVAGKHALGIIANTCTGKSVWASTAQRETHGVLWQVLRASHPLRLRLTPFGRRSHHERKPEPVSEPASPASKSAK